MTKVQFEKELERLLAGIPKVEQQKVLDYYNELFAEKYEHGMPEHEIILGFGSPHKIAADVLNESIFESKVKNFKTRTKSIFSNKVFLAFYLGAFVITLPLTIAFAAVVFAIGVTVLSLISAITVTGLATVITGPLVAGYGVYVMFGNANAGLALLGVGLAMIAVGILFFKSISILNRIRILIFVKKSNRPKAFAKIKSHKKSRIITSVICIGLILAGAGSFTLGYGRTDWDIKKLDTFEYTPAVYQIETAVTDIEVDTFNRVHFIKTDTDFRVEYHNYHKNKVTVSIDASGKMTITNKYKFSIEDSFNVFQAANIKKQDIYVYLPSEVIEDNDIDWQR